jgi:hypothetical protein
VVGRHHEQVETLPNVLLFLPARLPQNGVQVVMQRILTSLSLILFLTLMAQPAAALPAPMSDSGLLQKSDLVALVRVLSVTCTGVTKDERRGEDLPSWSAKVELMEVIKGEDAKGSDVTISFHAIPTGLLGAWSVHYYPGEMVWTHLVGKDGDYTTTWWNGRGDVVSKAVITDLPTKPGETAEIPRRSGQSNN